MSTANQGILLVCMGNICRSPTAEAILRATDARGLEHDVQVDSAGTHAYHTGEAPTHAHARRHRLQAIPWMACVHVRYWRMILPALTGFWPLTHKTWPNCAAAVLPSGRTNCA